MERSTFLAAATAGTALLPGTAYAAAAASPDAGSPPGIHVDIPVALKNALVAVNMEHLAFAGDMPVGITHMGLMIDHFKQTNSPYTMIAVFHGPAGYMLLDDRPYDQVRKGTAGNPYKSALMALVGRGVALEMCAVTMKAFGWTNAQLLPVAKVNAGAEVRLVQLQQMGYVAVHP